MRNNPTPLQLNRRAFLVNGTLLLSGAATCHSPILLADEQQPSLRIGMVTDLHYADRPPAGSRYYRETLRKLEESASQFDTSHIDFLVELGDLIDAAETIKLEQKYLKTINNQFSQIAKERYYVLGNHCVDILTKDEFLGAVEQEKSYQSFDRGGFHFIILDACFRSDGVPYGRKNSKWTDANLPQEELDWLAADLKATDKKVIVFAHQRLDVSNNHGVRNCPDIRKILEKSGKVLAVFQGHSHRNDLKEINGIHYCTMVAMVEGTGPEHNGYSVLELTPDGTIRLEGFRQQKNYRWASATSSTR